MVFHDVDSAADEVTGPGAMYPSILKHNNELIMFWMNLCVCACTAQTPRTLSFPACTVLYFTTQYQSRKQQTIASAKQLRQTTLANEEMLYLSQSICPFSQEKSMSQCADEN